MESEPLEFCFFPEEDTQVAKESEFFLFVRSDSFPLPPSDEVFNFSVSNLLVTIFLILLEGTRVS